jgi:hypothetical protein
MKFNFIKQYFLTAEKPPFPQGIHNNKHYNYIWCSFPFGYIYNSLLNSLYMYTSTFLKSEKYKYIFKIKKVFTETNALAVFVKPHNIPVKHC